MSDTTIQASAPALVLVFPKPATSERDSESDHAEFEDEHDGNVFVGLKFATIIYLVLAAGIASVWQLCRLL